MLTPFQIRAIDKIARIGGSVHYREDRSFRDWTGDRVLVPSGDMKTEGRVGWPTVHALVDEGYMVRREANEYALTSKVKLLG